MMRDLNPEVVVVGGGPAGLTAAAELAPSIGGGVLVLEREQHAGGIPRHSDHSGYGLRDLHRLVSGPEYARRLVDSAHRSGALVRTRAMVTGTTDDGALEVTSPEGRFLVRARATVLATGARERPRAARLVPGDRPHGVYTTGQLQNLVHVHHQLPGSRAVVVGAELVSWSAVLTLREARCRTVLMTTTHATPESYAALTLAGRIGLRVPVAPRTRVVAVHGRGRVRAVEVEDLGTGLRRTIECDTVVFTGDWIPDHELARSTGLSIDPGSRGPAVDAALRTDRPGVFAIGNLIHPVDTADVAALDGRHVAAQVRAHLAGDVVQVETARIHVEVPLLWVTPSVLRLGAPRPPRGRLLLSTRELVRRPHVVVRRGGQVVAHRRLPWPASPGRVFRVPSDLVDRLDPRDGDVTIGIG